VATTGTRAIDELAVLVRPAAVLISRKLPEIVLGIAAVLTALAVFALAGAAVDDHTISSDRGVTTAEVLDGSNFLRTLVRFTAVDGQLHVPELGVFYPRGLQPGTTVDVEYNLAHPDLVRVAGRSALDGVLPLGGGVLVAWAVLFPLSRWLRRRRAVRS
jgi:hypothetical protein